VVSGVDGADEFVGDEADGQQPDHDEQGLRRAGIVAKPPL
jgi:hypothetical protein